MLDQNKQSNCCTYLIQLIYWWILATTELYHLFCCISHSKLNQGEHQPLSHILFRIKSSDQVSFMNTLSRQLNSHETELIQIISHSWKKLAWSPESSWFTFSSKSSSFSPQTKAKSHCKKLIKCAPKELYIEMLDLVKFVMSTLVSRVNKTFYILRKGFTVPGKQGTHGFSTLAFEILVLVLFFTMLIHNMIL